MMTSQTDRAGQPYSSLDNKPAADQTAVTIHTSIGPVPGKMIGGTAVPDKTKP